MRALPRLIAVLGIALTATATGANPLPEPEQPPCTIATRKKANESCVVCKRKVGDAERCHVTYERVGYEFRCDMESERGYYTELWCRSKPDKK